MTELDDTDLEILRLLAADARRPYSEIAERVDRSPPTISDRIDRLEEVGVIDGFTVEIDRSQLAEGTPLLVEIDCELGCADDVRAGLAESGAVEQLLTTADGRVLATLRLTGGDDVESLLDATIDADDVRSHNVTPLARSDRQTVVDPDGFAVDCAECGNTVTAEGERERIGGELRHFCCSSCRDNFAAQYERLSDGAD